MCQCSLSVPVPRLRERRDPVPGVGDDQRVGDAGLVRRHLHRQRAVRGPQVLPRGAAHTRHRQPRRLHRQHHQDGVRSQRHLWGNCCR